MDNKNDQSSTLLVHGGQLNEVAQRYQIPLEQWLDLSTGISPISYPIPTIPAIIWQQLPQPNQAMLTAAKKYYGTENISVTSGSQAVIARLPALYLNHINQPSKCLEVWLPEVGYKEHERAWHDAGFTIKHYQHLPTRAVLSPNAIVVVINPNNPTGELQQQQTLTTLLTTLESLSGWLIVDEAFMDVITPSQSLIHLTLNKHLFVLRSIGKFFGLAGIRIGFVSAHPAWINKLQKLSSPWEVNGPAQFITEQALKDKVWQLAQQQQLIALSIKLEALLVKTFLHHHDKSAVPNITITGCGLFKTLVHPQATELYQKFCYQGLYVRLCDEKNALRFGIPDQEKYQILASLLAEHSHS
ncbi:threonine-phosphate decarboxylase [Colwellia hornerae]|uniref:Aminotransferase n=1 Tax=Colwellia hornerae TaxID=89402 RepID=A0A5C6Q596_9GAMM|nr:threonine-phosphate decarboxylase [Colwellia hornerae]TWX48080.1 pyridoxal phosphate-dependent class II aminotransferase [Colwellia hornerae]TWX54899.1 pyridoxal phosphate-dependent class II aminotransferase [Colwellia hornerae]TWX63757.1 pyridoxal phosphate-dependent class II aminotransferase [Colwellia hornerae]